MEMSTGSKVSKKFFEALWVHRASSVQLRAVEGGEEGRGKKKGVALIVVSMADTEAPAIPESSHLEFTTTPTFMQADVCGVCWCGGIAQAVS